MAAVQNARDLALQATSPRIVPVALPTNTTVDLSNTSQALNNLPSYLRVSGITAISTQSALDLAGSYIIGNLSAARISAGTLSAGVVYAGSITANQILSGTATYDSSQVVFGLGVAYAPTGTIAGVSGRAYGASKLAGAFAQYNTNGFALAAAAGGGTGSAFVGLGGWNSITNTYTAIGYVGLDTVGGRFSHFATGNRADIGTPTHAVYGVGAVETTTSIKAGTTLQAMGAFGCNGATPQGKVTIGAALGAGATLAEVIAKCNLFQYILVQNGQAQA